MKKTLLTVLTLTAFTNINSQICTTSVTANPICIGQTATLSVASQSFNCNSALPLTLQTSLAAYYPFCGNANDASGNVNNGTVTGATLTADRFGNPNSAYSFNGTSDYIQIPHSASLTYSNNLISISFWMKVTTWPTDGLEHYLFAKHSSVGTTQMGYHMYLHGIPSQPIVYRYRNGVASSWGGSSALTNTLVMPGSWFNVVVTTDNLFDKIYVNGVLTYTASSQIIGANTNPLFIGQDPVGGVFYGGILDDIAIYNKALSQSEVNQLYNLGVSTYSWSTGAITNSIVVMPTTTTNYTATSSNGYSTCNSVLTITASPQPTVTASTSNSLICVGESVTLTAGGASTFTWSSGVVGANIIVSPTITSTYTVTGNNIGCSNSSVTVTQNVSPCSGINELNQNRDIKIYPNPNNGSFVLQIENEITNGEIIVFNSVGQKVYQQEILKGVNNINSNGLEEGIYFYFIKEKNQIMKAGKIIISK